MNGLGSSMPHREAPWTLAPSWFASQPLPAWPGVCQSTLFGGLGASRTRGPRYKYPDKSRLRNFGLSSPISSPQAQIVLQFGQRSCTCFPRSHRQHLQAMVKFVFLSLLGLASVAAAAATPRSERKPRDFQPGPGWPSLADLNMTVAELYALPPPDEGNDEPSLPPNSLSPPTLTYPSAQLRALRPAPSTHVTRASRASAGRWKGHTPPRRMSWRATTS